MKQLLARILRKSEKYVGTDTKYFAKNFSFLFSGQLMGSFVTLIFAIFISRIIPQYTYGYYKYILSIIELATVLTLSGAGTAIIRAVAQGYEGNIKKFYRIHLLWSLIPTTALAIAALYYYTHDNVVLSTGLIVGAVLFPLFDSGDVYSAYFAGKKLFKALSLAQFLKTLTLATAVLTTAYFTREALPMAIAYIVTNTIVTTSLYMYTMYRYKPNDMTDTETVRLTKHGTFINTLAQISDRIDNLLIFQFLNPIYLAIYNFAEAIPNVIQGMLKQVYVLAVPKFVNSTQTKFNFLSKTFFVILFNLPFVLVYIVCAKTLFTYLFPNYLEAVFYSQLLILGSLITSAIPLAYLESKTAIKERYILSLVSNLSKIPILVLSVMYWGLVGIIIGKLLAKAIGFILCHYLAYSHARKTEALS